MKGFWLSFFIFFIFFSNSVCSFEYNEVKEITINNDFLDFNIFIDLGYYKISDSNNSLINTSNFFYNLDLNQFKFKIDSLDYRERNYNLVIDENIDLKEKDLYFDLNNLVISGSLGNIFDLNLVITNFSKKGDLFFLISDTNLFVYSFADSSFNYLFRIDTNQPIYNLEYLSYLDHNYLFLANGSNGVGIYEVDLNSDIFALNIGQVPFSYSGFDYNTSFVYYFESIYSGDYLFVFVNHFTQLRFVLYDLSELINLGVDCQNGFIIGGNYTPQSIWHNKDLNKLIIPLKNSDTTGYLNYVDDPLGLSVFSSGQFAGNYTDLDSLDNIAFVIDQNNFKSFNKNQIGGPISPIKTLDVNKPIKSFVINRDSNLFYLLFDNNIKIVDYNILDNDFSVIRTISGLDSDLNKIIFDNDAMFISQKGDLTKINLDQNYSLTFFVPFPKITSFSLNPNNINYSLYNSFLGDLNFSFVIEDYNILKNDSDFSPLTFDINLTNENRSLSILKDQNIDNNICENLDLTSKYCSFLINIKNINNSYSLTNGNYEFVLLTNQLKKIPFIFNLSRPSGGSGGSHTSSSSSSCSLPTPKPPQSVNYKEVLDLLEQNYITKKDLFDSYLLDFPILNFDLNVDCNTFSSDYNSLLEAYNNLPNIDLKKTTISNKLPFFDNKEYDVINNYSKKITFLTSNNKKYIFVEIDLNFNENIILDNLDYSKVIETTEDLNKFDSNFVIINKDLNYLLLDSAQNNYFDLIEIVKKSKEKEIISTEAFLEEEIKEVKNYKITYGVIIFILFLLLFCFRHFFFN
jgi:hypothetical protein